MTFLEAALQILRREGRPLPFKEIADRAVAKQLLTFVGRTPEVTMQTQLTAAVNKSPGNPFVRPKPGFFGLLRYPELSDDEKQQFDRMPSTGALADVPRPAGEPGAGRGGGGAGDGGGEAGRGRRRGRRGGRNEGEMSPPGRGAGAAEAAGEGVDFSVPGTRGAIVHDTDDENANGGAPAAAQPVAARVAARSESSAAVAAAAGLGTGQGEFSSGGEPRESAAVLAAAAGDSSLAGRRRRRRRRRRGGEFGAAGGVGGEAVAGEEGTFADGAADEGLEGGEGDDEELEAAPGIAAGASAEGQPGSGAPAGGDFPASEIGANGDPAGGGADAGRAAGADSGSGGDPRRILTPIDAAIEVLRGQSPGRGVHVRQIADTAVRRRLVHGEPHEAWRVMRAALATEPKERLRNGLRPRVRAAGSGLYALARRPADMDLEKSEHVFGEARRALRERTLASLEQRLCELGGGAFEALGRVLLQREGFGPATFVKRVEGTVYVEALRGRGFRPSRCLIGLRPGGAAAGRRAVGELRAGVRARNLDEGVLLLAGRLGDDAINEWKQSGSPIEVVDGPSLAESCVRHGIGVLNATVSVDFVDADFFAELSEG